MTIQQLADAAGMSRSQVSRIESGECRLMLHDAKNISQALGIAPEDLLRGFLD
jgi:transcriptional regulator with XRE-family HTH domain